MKKPEKKEEWIKEIQDVMGITEAENARLRAIGYNLACDEWERWLKSLPYFQDGDGDKYAIITNVENGIGKKICLPSEEEIEKLLKELSLSQKWVKNSDRAKAIYKRIKG